MSPDPAWPPLTPACPVRGCGLPLGPDAEARSLSCAEGHRFDRARSGYVSLIQPQDRRSVRAGDRAAAVEARARWLARGHMDGLAEAVAERLADELRPPDDTRVLDAGCGNGWALAALVDRFAVRACGIDLSTTALRLAARRVPEALWIAANADRRLPFPDRCIDAVLSVFGRRNPTEFARVLVPGGSVVAVVPGPRDLAELRAEILGRADARERAATLVAEFADFRVVARERWTARRELGREAIADLLASTYRGERRRERERALRVGPCTVTLSADLVVFRSV